MSEFNEIITSRQNKYISELCSLADRKARDKTRLFRFDGIKLASEALMHNVNIEYIVLDCEKADRVIAKVKQITGQDISLLPSSDIRVIYTSSELFSRISEEKSPEGIICVAKYIDNLHFKIYNKEDIKIKNNESVLILESVRDPSNVGAVIRSAAAMGADCIVMSEDCADIYNSKTVRSSMGTLFRMKIIRTDDLCNAIEVLKSAGRRVYAAALDRDALKLGSFKISANDCAVIGNEGHGLSQNVIRSCDRSVYIPMVDGVESLNATSAASIILWEFFGRRK